MFKKYSFLFISALLASSLCFVACDDDDDDDGSGECLVCSGGDLTSDVDLCVGDEQDPVNMDAGQWTKSELENLKSLYETGGATCAFE